MNPLPPLRALAPCLVAVVGVLNGLLTGRAAASPRQTRPPAVSFVARVPADVVLSPGARHLALLNRCDAPRARFAGQRKTDALRAGAAAAVDAVARRLAAELDWQLTRRDTLAAGTVAPPLAAAAVQALCKRWHTPRLLALEGFEAATRKAGTDWELRGRGTVSRTVAYDLVVRTHWALYDAQGRVLHRATAETARPHDRQSGDDFQPTIAKGVAGAGDAIREMAGYTGEQYARRYLPRDTALVREYYAGGDLAAAGVRVQQHDWAGAAALLQGLAGSPDARVASQAAHNLSVVCEATGDLDEALRWAAHARATAPGDPAARRVLELQERQQAALKRQARRAAGENVSPPNK